MTVLPFQAPHHFPHADLVDRIFGRLTGRTPTSAHTWLGKGHQYEVTLALQAFREAEAWARRESWAAPLRSELDQLPVRSLDWDLILEHHELDQADDGWRVAYLNRPSVETRRQWCRAASRFHAANAMLLVALKQESA